MHGFRQQDFDIWHIAARVVLSGQDPYATIRDPLGRRTFFYPLTTPLFFVPATPLPTIVAGCAFVGLSCGLLAFALTRDAWWRLLVFLSGSLYVSVVSAQMSPLLTAAMLLPGLSWLGALKPNIAIAMLAYRPSWRTGLTMLLITALTIPVMPNWPLEWAATAAASPYHFAAWQAPGGILLLAAITRWRRPEARLLAALAIVPTAPIVYEVLPLFVIPRDRREMMLLVILSDVAALVTMGYSSQLETAAFYARARWSIVWFMFVPTLLMVLLRPNQGAVPDCIERRTQRLPRWLRGQPMTK